MADLDPVDEPIHVCEHDPRWRSWFVDERDRVVRVVADHRA